MICLGAACTAGSASLILRFTIMRRATAAPPSHGRVGRSARGTRGVVTHALVWLYRNQQAPGAQGALSSWIAARLLTSQSPWRLL
jgi:hypothetical protein